MRLASFGLLLLLAFIPLLVGGAEPPGSGRPVTGTPVPQLGRLLPAPDSSTREYILGSRILYFGGIAWVLAGTCLLIRLRVCTGIRRYLVMKRIRPFATACLVWLAVVAWSMVWSLPLRLVSILWERRFGMDHSPWPRMALDFALDTGFYALFAPVVALAWHLYVSRRRRWWAWIGAALAPISLVTVVVWPVIADPLYNRMHPLPSGRLATRLRAMATRAGAGDMQILVSEHSSRSSTVNAYVTGVGPSHRMVLWDTALQQLTQDEVVAVAAHELGHYVYRHVWWGWALGACGTVVLFWFVQRLYEVLARRLGRILGLEAHGDVAGLPLMLLALRIAMLAQTPVEAAVSRGMESAADRYGIVAAGRPLASATAFARLARANRSDPDPPRWLVLWSYSHPPLRDRVGLALEAARRASPRPEPLHR